MSILHLLVFLSIAVLTTVIIAVLSLFFKKLGDSRRPEVSELEEEPESFFYKFTEFPNFHQKSVRWSEQQDPSSWNNELPDKS